MTRSGTVVKETVEYRSSLCCEDMPRKFLDIRFSEYPFYWERCYAPFPASGEDGVKGRGPCRFLGQRPKPSESLSPAPLTDSEATFGLFFFGSAFS